MGFNVAWDTINSTQLQLRIPNTYLHAWFLGLLVTLPVARTKYLTKAT